MQIFFSPIVSIGRMIRISLDFSLFRDADRSPMETRNYIRDINVKYLERGKRRFESAWLLQVKRTSFSTL